MNEPTKPVMMDPSEIHVDPELRALMPRLSNAEFALLRESIKNAGIRDPVIVFLDPETGMRVVLDGDNRRAIAIKLKLKLPVTTIEFACRVAAMEWAIKNQLGRRNLSSFARVRLALKLKTEEQEAAKGRQRRSPGAGKKGHKKSDGVFDKTGQVYTRLGEIAGVSHDTVRKVERIIEHAPNELIRQLERSEIRINAAHELIKPTKRKEPKPTAAEDGEQNTATEGGRRAAEKNSRLTPAKRRGSKSSNQDRKAPEKQDVSSSAEADSEGTPSQVATAVAGDADDECRDGTSERPDTEGEGVQETEAEEAAANDTVTFTAVETTGAISTPDSAAPTPTYSVLAINIQWPDSDRVLEEEWRDLSGRLCALPIAQMSHEDTVILVPAPRQFLLAAAECLFAWGVEEIVPITSAELSGGAEEERALPHTWLVGAKDLSKIAGLPLICEPGEIFKHIEAHIGVGAVVFADESREKWACYDQDFRLLESEDTNDEPSSAS